MERMTRPSPQTDRVVALIGLLSAGPDRSLTLAELTRRLGVNKSSCYSMLCALVKAGWLLRDPRRKTYRLGPGLIAIGRRAADGFPAFEFAREMMEDLSLELHLHCTALAVHDDAASVLEQVQDPAALGVGFQRGAAYPLHSPPFGAAVFAWSDDETIERWLGEGDRRDEYLAALEAIRARGFGIELLPASPTGYRQLLAKLNERASGKVGGPSVEQILAELSDLAGQVTYLPVELDPDVGYHVNDLNAPVFGDDGRVVLLLALSGFRQALRGSEIHVIGERLRSVTDEVTSASGGRNPRPGHRRIPKADG
jgi:DNA-binding IclR family transcriptional regulator